MAALNSDTPAGAHEAIGTEIEGSMLGGGKDVRGSTSPPFQEAAAGGREHALN